MGHVPAKISAKEPRGSTNVSAVVSWRLFLFGAAYGLLMRFVFTLWPFNGDRVGKDAAQGPMMFSFVVLVPLVIGALTVVYAANQPRSLAYAIFGPWLSMLVFLGGTIILLVEGSICVLMALPIFLAVSSLGGLIGWIVVKLRLPSRSTMHSLLLVPLVSGAVEVGHPLPALTQTSDASVRIAAKPDAIWKLINDAHAIRPEEMRDGLAWRIGVPLPQSALTVDTTEGRVRKLRWDKGVHFDEPITDWQENRYIRWRYVFAPDSFPVGALDEHVRIGGRYFDLVDTSYRLTPEGDGTRLDIHVTWRVNTEFNWYAGPAGRLLVEDAARQILAFYKHRAESPAGSMQ